MENLYRALDVYGLDSLWRSDVDVHIRSEIYESWSNLSEKNLLKCNM